MRKEILTSEQIKLLPLLKIFSKEFGLVGGTAIALHLGHRRSIDFDLFSNKEFGNQALLNKILKLHQPDQIIVNRLDELTLVIRGVKFTFFNYQFKIEYNQSLDNIIKIPDLCTLAAMKAFALGMRSKWKDYVDLFFIIGNHFSIKEISRQADQIFSGHFNEKLFRNQLSYFEGIDYTEPIEFLPGFEIKDDIIKKALTDFSLS